MAGTHSKKNSGASWQQPGRLSVPIIARIYSVFKQKFGVPRQSGLVASAQGVIRFLPDFDQSEALAGLATASHLWISFVFHENIERGWQPSVRPPRLGGNRKMGVFATRSSFRPSGLGLSVVKLEHVDDDGVHVSGIDMVDGTPIVDIRPYVPYADCLPAATNTFASDKPEEIAVTWCDAASKACVRFQQNQTVDIAQLVTQILSQNPKPSYHAFDASRTYAMKILNLDVRWRYCDLAPWTIEVIGLNEVDTAVV